MSYTVKAFCPRCAVDPDKVALCRTGPQSRVEVTCPNCATELRLGVTVLALPGIPRTWSSSGEAEEVFNQMVRAA